MYRGMEPGEAAPAQRGTTQDGTHALDATQAQHEATPQQTVPVAASPVTTVAAPAAEPVRASTPAAPAQDHGDVHAAASEAAPSRVPLNTVFSHVAIPIVMGFLMLFAYLGGFHHPTMHRVPVAVVGTAQSAGTTAAQIQSATGDALDIRVVPTQAQAEDELRHLRIYGAFVPSATQPTLLIASASNNSATSSVTQVFTNVALQENRPLHVRDVVPVTAQDPVAQNNFFYMVPLTVGSYAAAIAIGAAGATRRFRERLALVVGTGVVLSSLYLGAAMVVFNVFAGHGPAVWALSLLYSTTILAIGVGLHPLIGRFCALTFSFIFVALNFTSSGGVLAPELQNGFFNWLNEFWLGSGMLGAMRHVVYFPDSGLARSMWIMLCWLAVGLFCMLMAALNERRIARHRARATHAYETGRTEGRTQGHIEARRALIEEHSDDEDGSHVARGRMHRDGLDDHQRMELELEEDVAV